MFVPVGKVGRVRNSEEIQRGRRWGKYGAKKVQKRLRWLIAVIVPNLALKAFYKRLQTFFFKEVKEILMKIWVPSNWKLPLQLTSCTSVGDHVCAHSYSSQHTQTNWQSAVCTVSTELGALAKNVYLSEDSRVANAGMKAHTWKACMNVLDIYICTVTVRS